MDTEELICKCKAISIQEDSECRLSFKSIMKEKGGRIVANSLVGKILLARSIHTEEIRTSLVQAWRTTKEVKIESLGKISFYLSLARGPWHFDRAFNRVKETQ